MNSKEISKVLRSFAHTKNKFRGVFATENIPTDKRNLPYGFVANTDPSWLPGKHWVAVYVNTDEKVEFFDSFGRRPMNSSLKKLCGRDYIFNERILQSPLSTVCGQYCIYFLYKRCTGKSFKNIMKCFTRNTRRNDAFVTNFVNRKYPA